MSKLDKHMPGWVSNGPVQINVGRDLHIHGGRSAWTAVPDDCVPSPREFGPGLVFSLSRVWAAAWALVKALAWLVGGALVLTAWVVFGALALGVWLLGRVANAVLFVERGLGGAPTRLVYVPTVLQPKHTALQLGAGNDINEVKQLEREYDYSN